MKFDEIKIDKAFLDDIEHSEGNRVILDHIAAMAEDLGTDLIVEGVETERQIELIGSGKQRLAQGYFFSPPMELDKARDYAKRAKQEAIAIGAIEPPEEETEGQTKEESKE